MTANMRLFIKKIGKNLLLIYAPYIGVTYREGNEKT